MIKTIAILAAAVAIATPAAAAEVRVSFVGKDDATLKAEVTRAAQAVCKDTEHGFLATYFERQCIIDTIKETEAKIAVAKTAMASTPEKLASR
jgi:hypothetical protein